MPQKNLDLILQSVLKKITPSKEESDAVHAVIEDVVAETERIIKPLGLSVVLAGSFTRNTWLSHKKEFDIFVQFPVETGREELEKLGLESGKKIVKSFAGSFQIAYAEHPYVRAKIKGYSVDIVPCYKVESAEKIKSAVDRTPFHNRYLSKNLHPHQSADVRLLKTFCKANGLYGSDLKTQGFSGYLCELLIIKCDSFKNLVSEASKWLPGQVFIDIQGKYPGNKKEFSNQPLVVIDPVDPKRNVAAALSSAVFVKFAKLCVELSEHPSEKFFFAGEAKIKSAEFYKKIKSRETVFLAIKFSKPEVVDDIVYPQLRKSAKRLSDILKEYEFACLGSTVFAGNRSCFIILELEVWNLPNVRRIIGPPVFAIKNAGEFANKYRALGRIWVEEDRWVAEISRKFKQADKKLFHTLSEPAETLKAKGIASYMAESIAKGFKVLNNKQLLKSADGGLLKAIKDYLEESV